MDCEKRRNTEMLQGYFEEHWSDAQGNPAGGTSSGRGFTIAWQNGPLVVPGVKGMTHRREPNGAFVEEVLQAIIGRIAFYQQSRFACGENAEALQHLSRAADVLAARTRDRKARHVEGTHDI